VTRGQNTVSFSGALVIVPPTPATTSQSIISAASFLGNGAGNGAVSPGGLYALYPAKNASIGPVTGISNPPQFDAYGGLPTILGGVSITFDGVPAPLFYVSAGQINLQVPFEVAGKATTSMIVNYLGSASAPVSVPVLSVQPSLYSANYSGTGPVIAFHLKDGSLNTAQNPAARGDYVLLFGTGVGKVSYAVPTGQAAPAPPPGFTGNYTYSIGGSTAASALFGGWAPTFAGVAQWDLQIPTTSASGAVPVIVTDTATGASSQPGATIFVK
jgi:trimeric autotransporter adhesin